jgi:hypothetical protein
MPSAAEESSFDNLANLQSQLKKELAMAKESQSALEVILSPGGANKTRNSERYFTSKHEVVMQDPSVSIEPTILKVNSSPEVDNVLPSLKAELAKAKESQAALEFILTPIIASGEISRHDVIAKIDTAKSLQDPSSVANEETCLSIGEDKRNEVHPLVAAGDNLSCCDLIPEQNCTQQIPSTPDESIAIEAGFTSVEVYENGPLECKEESKLGSDTEERARKVLVDASRRVAESKNLLIEQGNNLILQAKLVADLKQRLETATSLANDHKLLLSARLLKGIADEHLHAVHRDILREAELFNNLIRDNAATLDGWTKQGEHTGRHNFTIHYKMNDKPPLGRDLCVRIESVVHSDLLVPIISVLNESELYSSFLPNWTVPKLRVSKSEKLQQRGRCTQIVNIETEVPWPLAMRQVIIKAVAIDDLDRQDDNDDSSGRIIIRLQSLDTYTNDSEGYKVPPTIKGAVRVKVKGGFIIEKVATDHPLVNHSLQYYKKARKDAPSREDLVSVTLNFCVDPQLSSVPKPFIDFFVRQAIGRMWNMFLDVAEGVKSGKQKSHCVAISQKRDLYDWVEERTRVMLEKP